MICEFGDVVIVPFPFVDIPVTKYRPALVLSSSTFNSENAQTILAMITTGAGTNWPSDIQIDDLNVAGLTYSSRIRWKLFTLTNELLERRIGKLGEPDRAAVETTARSVVAR